MSEIKKTEKELLQELEALRQQKRQAYKKDFNAISLDKLAAKISDIAKLDKSKVTITLEAVGESKTGTKEANVTLVLSGTDATRLITESHRLAVAAKVKKERELKSNPDYEEAVKYFALNPAELNKD